MNLKNKKPISISVSIELEERLKNYCKQQQQSVSQVVVNLIEKLLKKENKNG